MRLWHRQAGVCVRTVATALQRLRELGIPRLGAPLRRELAGRAVRARAGDQCLCRAAADPVARLQAVAGPASTGAGDVGGPASVVPPATVLAALETDLAGKVAVLASDPKDRLAAALARLEKHSLYSQFILQHMH